MTHPSDTYHLLAAGRLKDATTLVPGDIVTSQGCVEQGDGPHPLVIAKVRHLLKPLDYYMDEWAGHTMVQADILFGPLRGSTRWFVWRPGHAAVLGEALTPQRTFEISMSLAQASIQARLLARFEHDSERLAWLQEQDAARLQTQLPDCQHLQPEPVEAARIDLCRTLRKSVARAA